MSQNLESFGKYILLEKLAMGGMAEIYLAKHSGASGVSKFVAIKRILPQFTEQIEFIDMFKDEAKIAVNLSHANVVSIFEFGLEKNCFFLAMDYIEGRNLRQILNKMKKSTLSFSIEQVLYIIKEVAAGLDHAHRCIDANTGKPLNIIHRDMSPQNVMISFEGEVKIVDFGIAKAETQIETTRAGTLKGKFGYMSPEQAEGQPVDLRTDVFALGIVLWELLANDRLFVANNEINTLRKIRDCQIPSLRKINPNIPAELERIVGKALAKDRNLRYQTAAAFHRELSRFLNRQYPDFSPQDFSVFIKTLFAGEILESRKKMIEFSKFDLEKITAQAQAASAQSSQQAQIAPRAESPREKTIVTSTNTEMEGSDSAIDFGNSKHQPHPEQASAAAPQVPPTPPPTSTLGALRPTAPQPSTAPVPNPPESYSQPLRQPAAFNPPSAPRRPEAPLAFERTTSFNTSVREGSVRTQSRYSSGPSSSPVTFVLILIMIGSTLGGGAYYTMNPQRSKEHVYQFLAKIGFFTVTDGPSITPVQDPEPTEPKKSVFHTVKVVSTPSGAPIEVDGKPTGDITPATLTLEEGREVTVSVRLAGYLPSPYAEKFTVDGPRSIEARFKSDKKGFLNIVVRGEGQIYINGRMIASSSPARMIAVPADESLTIAAFDPRTNTSDQIVATVGEGATRTITLTPRAQAQPPRNK